MSDLWGFLLCVCCLVCHILFKIVLYHSKTEFWSIVSGNIMSCLLCGKWVTGRFIHILFMFYNHWYYIQIQEDFGFACLVDPTHEKYMFMYLPTLRYRATKIHNGGVHIDKS